jgi:hypothetical protein
MVKNNCKFCGIKEGELHKANCSKETKRGMPHFHRTQHCNRCGKEKPKIFMVSDKEWEKVVRYYYFSTDVLCKECFEYVKKTKQNWKSRGIDVFRNGINEEFLAKKEGLNKRDEKK